MHNDQRLRRRSDFEAAYREGRAVSNQLIVLRVRPNGLEGSRVGFVVGKVVGNAVVRNRVKRRLREIARGMAVMGGVDIVIGARKAAAAAEFDALKRAVVSLAARAGVAAGPPATVKP